MEELYKFRQFLKENKYHTKDEDGFTILDLDKAVEYLQSVGYKDAEDFIYDDESFENLPYDTEEFNTEDKIEAILRQGAEDYFEEY